MTNALWTNALVDKSMNNVFWEEFKRCSVRTLNLHNMLTKTLIFADLGTVGASEALRCTQSKKTWNDGATFPVEVDFPHFWAETQDLGLWILGCLPWNDPIMSPLQNSKFITLREGVWSAWCLMKFLTKATLRAKETTQADFAKGSLEIARGLYALLLKTKLKYVYREEAEVRVNFLFLIIYWMGIPWAIGQ